MVKTETIEFTSKGYCHIVNLTSEVAQKISEIKSFEEQLALQKLQASVEKEKLDIQASLLKQGYTSRRRYLEAKSAHQNAVVQKVRLEGDLAASKEMLVEAKANLAGGKANINRELADKRTQLAQELAELSNELGKLEDRHHRLMVRSPVEGFVKSLEVTGAGAVVNPGGLIAEVVPVNQNLIAEVRVKPSDVGHVKIGDPADISIAGYDPNIQGTLDGTVKTISASSFEDDTGVFYYKAIISFTEKVIGNGHNERSLLPGMQVNAKIVTGSKSIMRYMLKPVTRSLGNIFSER